MGSVQSHLSHLVITLNIVFQRLGPPTSFVNDVQFEECSCVLCARYSELDPFRLYCYTCFKILLMCKGVSVQNVPHTSSCIVAYSCGVSTLSYIVIQFCYKSALSDYLEMPGRNSRLNV
jgi:hypothetical protein